MTHIEQEVTQLKQRLEKLEQQMAFVLRSLGHEYPLPAFEGTDYGVSPEILALVRQGNKIEAIKLFRQGTGAGLKDAKDFIDALQKKLLKS
jgi:ribosomal protein L7/L12